jgi:hypothetical protein
MKLVVCAKSPAGSFIGLPSAAGYTVFSSDNKAAVRPGDILASPAWDDEEGDLKTVRNLTTAEEVRVYLIDWSLSLAAARDLISKREDDAPLVWHPPWPG